MRHLLILVLVLFIIFFGLSDEVLLAKSGFLRWIPFISIFTIIPFLLYKTLYSFNVRKEVIIIIPLISVLIVGPLFGIWTKKLTSDDLDKNGTFIIGVVSEKWQYTRHNSLKENGYIRPHLK